jgi:hypothetical protein
MIGTGPPAPAEQLSALKAQVQLTWPAPRDPRREEYTTLRPGLVHRFARNEPGTRWSAG